MIEIYGNPTSKDVRFEIIAFSGNPIPIVGQRIEDLTTQTYTDDTMILDQFQTSMDEIWIFDNLAALKGCQFRANIKSISGGNLIIKGNAVY